MEKKELVQFLDKMFGPLAFKRKGNNWVSNSEEISKIINLQKSNYGNAFYINFGYNINGLELTTTTHIGNRLSATDKDEQKRITDLLDFETEIDDEARLIELQNLIENKIIKRMKLIRTKKDLVGELQNRPHLNDIPIVVKKHLKL